MQTKRSLVICSPMFLFAFLVTFFWSCGGAGKLSPEEQAQHDAQAQAKKDSLARFELVKNWSLGYSNYRNKEYDRVVPFFWKVIELDQKREFKDVYTFLGEAYSSLGKADSAVIVYKMGIKVFSQNAYLHRVLGHYYRHKQDFQKAIRYYKIVISLEPKNTQDWEVLADLYVQIQAKENAIASYKQLGEFEPNNIEYPTRLLALVDDPAEKQKLLKKIIAIDPNNLQAILELAQQHARERNWAEAAKWYGEYHKRKPEDLIIAKELAQMFMNNEDYQQAIETYENMLSLDPKNIEAIIGQADSFRELGQLQTAFRLAKKAIAMEPKNGLGYIALGRAFEAVAAHCQKVANRANLDIDEKLVYKYAYQQYEKALAFPGTRLRARKSMAAIEPYLPTKEDEFFHPNKTRPSHACYSWVK